MKTKSLIKLQEETVAAILALRENGKRAMGYNITFLNKSRRGLCAVRRRYFAAASKMGFCVQHIEEQWGDIRDYASLCAICDE